MKRFLRRLFRRRPEPQYLVYKGNRGSSRWPVTSYARTEIARRL